MSFKNDKFYDFLDNGEIEMLKNYNYLIIGLNNIGYSICKNLISLNVDKVTLIDDSLTEDSNGNKKKNSDIIRKKLNKFAVDTEIGTGKVKDISLYVQNNNIIIINEIFSIDNIKIWNDIAIENKNKLVWNLNIYIKGLIITDFNFIRVKKSFTKNFFNKIINITNDENGRLTLEKNHYLENNDYISISEVEGMDSINGNECRPIKVLNKKEIRIENTKNLNKYINSGKITKYNVPHNLFYKRIYNIIEYDLLKNTYLIVKYGQISINLLFLFFNILKDNNFVESLKNGSLKDDNIAGKINEILNTIDFSNIKQNFDNIDALKAILEVIFKNDHKKDYVFNSIIGNWSFHEILKITGKFKPIPGFIIIDFLKYFPNININVDQYITNYFSNNNFKVLIVGYNRNTYKLTKILNKIISLGFKKLQIDIYDIYNKNKRNDLKDNTFNFINNPFKDYNKLLDYDFVLCLIYDLNIIENMFYKLKNNNKKLITVINFNYEINLIYKEEDYIKYNLLRKSKNKYNLILLNKDSNNLSLDLINYSNQIFKIIFVESIDIINKIFINKDELSSVNDNYLYLVYYKFKLIDIIFKKSNNLIEEICILSYNLIYNILLLDFDNNLILQFLLKNANQIKKFVKKFINLVLKIINKDLNSKLKEEVSTKVNNHEYSLTILNLFDVKYNIEASLISLNKLNNINSYRILFVDRLENNYESEIIGFIYSLSLILHQLYPIKTQIQKVDIKYHLGIFKNNLKSCKYFENILIILGIIKTAWGKDLDLALNFETNEYTF